VGPAQTGSARLSAPDGGPVQLAELVAALSLAADLASGVTLEHGLRTCLLASRLAERAGLDLAARRDVYYVSLLRSIGCTSDAHEQAALFGDEIAARAELNLAAHLPPRELLGVLVRHSGAGEPPLRGARALGRVLAAGRDMPRSVAMAHCAAAERLGRRLGFAGGVPEALNSLFERWDGKGFPRGQAGADIPRPACFTQVAYDALLLHEHVGHSDQVTAAAGSRYDPAVVALLRPDAAADFADLKSPWLLGHSRAVAELAEAAAWRMGMPPAEVETLRRAALLHDLGRVTVPGDIWDRPGPLRAAGRRGTDRARARGPDRAAQAVASAGSPPRLRRTPGPAPARKRWVNRPMRPGRRCRYGPDQGREPRQP
jgi:hypothetical protein